MTIAASVGSGIVPSRYAPRPALGRWQSTVSAAERRRKGARPQTPNLGVEETGL
jgi:hypothetical protein